MIAVVFSWVTNSQGQKEYFDKSGKATTEVEAYYYREKKGESMQYISKYRNGDGIYFEGKIAVPSSVDENQNVYVGECTWYYKNGKKKEVKNFNENGKLEGACTSYFESGKVWKEEKYAAGFLVDHTYREYNEDGSSAEIFIDHFDNNSNDWDVYESPESICKIENGYMLITAKTKTGTSRYINLPEFGDNWAIEIKLDISQIKRAPNGRAGIIFGFKDWDNYCFFAIGDRTFSVGTVYEGITSMRANSSFSSDVNLTKPNLLKIITNNEKLFFSINGNIQLSMSPITLPGRGCGVVVNGKMSVKADDFIFKKFDDLGNERSSSKDDESDVRSAGSGLVFTNQGHILTNFHVVENSKAVVVELNRKGVVSNYKANVVVVDKDNDLALLQIADTSFRPYTNIPFSIKHSGGIDVGSSVFTLGFPLAYNGMGKEVKLSDGKVSAKTGFQNATNSFTTTIPVQPGNSGGPIFNSMGELIGLINAKIQNADNVSYGIKSIYIFNLLDMAAQTPPVPESQELNNTTLEQQVKVLSDYITLIKIK